uniref:CID domain-containing protein n=1 Tax=Attheya septentrionalis TaxID=420275 RepID=A0A7S2XVM5_9STRA|mmetsp:Transcript_5763/g.10200  ORF Transcript_5763/g.10200 Transcript_5763/m.10200 type:complete len:651 (+) Transcript_5763:948-2900(+)
MWPRTEEERARNRNTGFVCFMERDDAQDAMDAFCDSDPMNTGRRMMLRWGKNVKKSVKRGTGGVPIPPIRKRQRAKDNKDNDKDTHHTLASNENKYENENETNPTETFNDRYNKRRKTSMEVVDSSTLTNASTGGIQDTNTATVVEPDSSIVEEVESSFRVTSKPERPNAPIVSIPKYDPTSHADHAIRVVAPSDPKRLALITTVASFVAKDGSILERKLMEKESNNPDFCFLTEQELPISDFHNHNNNTAVNGHPSNQWKQKDQIKQEQIFYRWRVFAFAQGDGFKSWRTEPFVMIEPHGCFWIPPSLDREEALREEQATKLREEEILSNQEERRRITSDTNSQTFMTGRQLEHAKFGKRVRSIAEGDKLTDEEQTEWKDILSNQLCASRQIICEAMSFCFDKSFAATQISSILKDAMLEDGPSISVETRIARLFLLSDVLFNSQQPGVRNAFRFRDAIESMAPAVFTSLGKHGQGMAGRMTMNKLRTAVSSVLSAWTNWSVYNHTFLDELHAHFEGRDPAEISKKAKSKSNNEEDTEVSAQGPSDESSERDDHNVSEGPRGDWSEVDENLNRKPQGEFVHAEDADGEALDEDEDLDGEALDEGDDVDGEALDGDDDIDGVALEDEDDDIDGVAISGDDEINGEEWTGM